MMNYTIEYDKDWDQYDIAITDQNNNNGYLTYYKDEKKLYWVTFVFNNHKTCSGRNLKANHTRLSIEEYKTIETFNKYIKEVLNKVLQANY